MSSLSHLLTRISVCGAACLVVGAIAGACSATLDFTECHDDADCASFFDDNKPMYCAPDKVCRVSEDGCRSHSQCAGLGPSFICTATSECASTESEQCGAPIWPGGEMSDDVMLMGVMLPKEGADKELGLAMEKAVLAAVDEFNASGELQGGSKIAPVVCDTKTDKDTAIAAARHLGDALTVPVFVGPIDDIEFTAVADKVTFVQGVLAFTMGPMITTNITDLDSANLLFSAMAGAAYQGQAIRGRIAADFAADPTADSILLVSEDAYGQGGLYTVVAPGPLDAANSIPEVPGVQKMSSYLGIDNPTSGKGAKQKLDSLLTSIPEPSMLVLLGRAEVAEIITYYQSLGKPMPDRIYVPHRAMPAIAALADPSLAGVVVAVAPELDTPALDTLRARVGDMSLPGEAALAYDATMASMLAMAVVKPGDAVVGPTVAKSVPKLSDTAGVAVDFSEAPSKFVVAALAALKMGQTLDLKGFSGPLDFDAEGEVCGSIAAYTLDDTGAAWVKTAVYSPDCPASSGMWADVP